MVGVLQVCVCVGGGQRGAYMHDEWKMWEANRQMFWAAANGRGVAVSNFNHKNTIDTQRRSNPRITTFSHTALTRRTPLEVISKTCAKGAEGANGVSEYARDRNQPDHTTSLPPPAQHPSP